MSRADPPLALPPLPSPCAECRQERGGYGSAADYPPPSIWRPVAEVGAAWCAPLTAYYLCFQCGSVHKVIDNYRDGVTDIHRLRTASRAWFTEDDPVDVVVRAWLTEDPLASATVSAGMDVLNHFRYRHPGAGERQVPALFAPLTDPTIDPNRARVLLVALTAVRCPLPLPSVDPLLAPHLLRDRHWLPTLSRWVHRQRFLAVPEHEWQRLVEVCAWDRVLAGILERMSDAADRGDWRTMELESEPVWTLIGDGLRPTAPACEAVETLAERVAALPTDTVVPRASFGEPTPQALAESLHRLAQNCRYWSGR